MKPGDNFSSTVKVTIIFKNLIAFTSKCLETNFYPPGKKTMILIYWSHFLKYRENMYYG